VLKFRSPEKRREENSYTDNNIKSPYNMTVTYIENGDEQHCNPGNETEKAWTGVSLATE
jgi:hypothetical protein